VMDSKLVQKLLMKRILPCKFPRKAMQDCPNYWNSNSPSIYLAFSTLFTEDACSTGPVLPATTIAFRQDELSTYGIPSSHLYFIASLTHYFSSATGWKWNTEEYISRPPRVNTDYILATWVRNQLYVDAPP
jgi:hypothetical protein